MTAPDLIDQAIQEAMAAMETPAPDSPEAPEAVEGEQPELEEEVTEEPEEPEAEEAEEPEDESEEVDEEEVDEADDGAEVDGPVEVADDATYRLPDGTEVSGAELRNGLLRQADYTRKTQEVADQRREVEDLYTRMADWYEQNAANPAGWIASIASETDNPAGTIAEAVGATQDPTDTLARLIVGLAEGGKLDAEFVTRFGLDEVVATKAPALKADSRLSQIERQLQEEREARTKAEQQAADAARQQHILDGYQREWQSIVTDHGLSFATAEAERDAKLEVMRFARDKEIPSLEAAYAAKAYMEARKVAPAKNDDAKKAVERKRRTRAMSPKAPPAGPAPRKAGDHESALKEAAAELGLDLS